MDDKLIQEVVTNILRIIDGAYSSPDYPANCEGILGEIQDELDRLGLDHDYTDAPAA